MKKRLTKDRLIKLDTELYHTIINANIGVTDNSVQNIRWFIDTKDLVHSKKFVVIIKQLLSEKKYFKSYKIDVVENKSDFTIIIQTPDFLFNLQNILTFSDSLFQKSQQLNAKYDFWEIEVPSE